MVGAKFMLFVVPGLQQFWEKSTLCWSHRSLYVQNQERWHKSKLFPVFMFCNDKVAFLGEWIELKNKTKVSPITEVNHLV